MKFKNYLIGCIAVAGLAGAASPASAAIWDLTIDWSSAATGAAAVTETATIDSTAGGAFDLGRGVWVGYALLSDNLGNGAIVFTPASNNGLIFTEGAGGIYAQDYANPALYTNIGGSSADIAPGHTYDLVNGSTLTVTAAPEASTWAMMLLGFAGLAFVGYRQKQGLFAQSA
jgi:hypothetical protein